MNPLGRWSARFPGRKVVVTSFFIPPEWIAAHGFRPVRLMPAGSDSDCGGCAAGFCPYAEAFLDETAGATHAAIVMATSCDQQRRAAELAATRGDSPPVFLFHVPKACKSPAAREYYTLELERLGRFLTALGGTAPSPQAIVETFFRFDEARKSLRRLGDLHRDGNLPVSARTLAEWRTGWFSSGVVDYFLRRLHQDIPEAPRHDHPPATRAEPRIGLIGGPLFLRDMELFDWIEAAGARVMLDGTEHGERTLPEPLNFGAALGDPLETLTAAYFDAIPDIALRPNDRLYQWLIAAIRERELDGLIVRHHLWCDLWQTELRRIQQLAAVPVLPLDSAAGPLTGPAAAGRTRTRVEAFIETLAAQAAARP